MKLKFPAFVGLIMMLAVDAPSAVAQQANEDISVQEIRTLLDSIHPYLPSHEVKSEIDLFGATSMDSMAHGWAVGFKKFHPDSNIVISAEGSETVFDRIAKNPSSIAMVSRPVSDEDLKRLKG